MEKLTGTDVGHVCARNDFPEDTSHEYCTVALSRHHMSELFPQLPERVAPVAYLSSCSLGCKSRVSLGSNRHLLDNSLKRRFQASSISTDSYPELLQPCLTDWIGGQVQQKVRGPTNAK